MSAFGTKRTSLVAPHMSVHTSRPPFPPSVRVDTMTCPSTLEEAMRRREFIALFGGAAVAWPFAAGAQKPRKMHRIGVLWHATNEEEESNLLGGAATGVA